MAYGTPIEGIAKQQAERWFFLIAKAPRSCAAPPRPSCRRSTKCAASARHWGSAKSVAADLGGLTAARLSHGSSHETKWEISRGFNHGMF
jgi:hypothetical protein